MTIAAAAIAGVGVIAYGVSNYSEDRDHYVICVAPDPPKLSPNDLPPDPLNPNWEDPVFRRLYDSECTERTPTLRNSSGRDSYGLFDTHPSHSRYWAVYDNDTSAPAVKSVSTKHTYSYERDKSIRAGAPPEGGTPPHGVHRSGFGGKSAYSSS